MTVEQAIQIAVSFETTSDKFGPMTPEDWESVNEANTLIGSLSPNFQKQVVGTIQKYIRRYYEPTIELDGEFYSQSYLDSKLSS